MPPVDPQHGPHGTPGDALRRLLDRLPGATPAECAEILRNIDPALRADLERLLAAAEIDREGDSTRIPPRSSSAPRSTDSYSLSPLLDQPPDLVAGGAIGGYRVIAELGRGGFGAVYKAIDTRRLARTVAVKVLRLDRQSPNVVNHFRREMEILKELHHENIVGYLDDGEDAGRLFYVMEYVDGIPITDFADRNRLSIEERIDLFANVCEAIDFAHGRLIVHRDLKPRNILVTTDGRRQVKVLDFGIATFSDPNRMADENIVTISAENAMTPEYASPEQLRGVGRMSVLVDVYALGVILYELLAGHLPYSIDRAKAAAALAEQIEHAKPIAPSQRIGEVLELPGPFDPDTGLPSTRRVTPEAVALLRGTRPDRLRRQLAGELDLIALMAIRPEAERRYRRVADLLDDIVRYRGNLPIRARPDSVMYRAQKFGRRHRWPLVAGAIACVGLVSAALAIIFVLRAEAARSRAEVEKTQARLAALKPLADLLVQHARGFTGTFRAREEVTAMGLSYIDRAINGSAASDPEFVLREVQLANLMLSALAEVNSPQREAMPGVRKLRDRAREVVDRWEHLIEAAPGSDVPLEILVGIAEARRNVARLERAVADLEVDPPARSAAVAVAAQAAGEAAKAGFAAWREGPDASTAVAVVEGYIVQLDVVADASDKQSAADLLGSLLADPRIARFESAPGADPGVLLAMARGHIKIGFRDVEGSGSGGPSRYGLDPENAPGPSAEALLKAKDHHTLALGLLLRIPPPDRGSVAVSRLFRDVHQQLARTERELVRIKRGGVEQCAGHIAEFDRLASEAWSRDPDIEESFSNFSRAHELKGRLAWVQGDHVRARAELDQAVADLVQARLLASPREAPLERRVASRLARREAIVRSDLALLLHDMREAGEATLEAERAKACWDDSTGGGALSTDDLRYLIALEEAGLLKLP